jgi:hypothetical protein
MMEAESTSETSVNFYQTTQRNIPQDSNLHGVFKPTWLINHLKPNGN